ncbi:MAG: hypothetical protein QXK06_00085 [Candidatus Diapherotrites archaeon]
MLAIALCLFFIAIILFALNQPFFSLLFFLSGLFVLAGTLLHKGGKYSAKKIKQNASKIASDMQKATPSSPENVIGEGLNVLGKKAGDDLWEQKKSWAVETKSVGIRERLGTSSKALIKKFQEIFK